ncbi:uncharacterized protein LOC119689578 [Teleopsis dalmanni]|uniref:uncharacterized protein LOC119689578 n=1 Tax=Teleopsis dalmanni TaxID=139649 RepID=UPI0018CFD479|nr:uncharacterized protein LOC119689578 [Teleopsis dalmanni]XP_037960365.1 uncharacterized protein LOC119689578 [Teleopsis dalmanni]XP_037960366.1 uncharacterized protein LOC119689578 [Teleopsis dalmanni]XP_037960367.1 uncharacterized protein LOC119689578 [Teleopsis dalmanni]
MSPVKKQCLTFTKPQPVWNTADDVQKIVTALQNESVVNRIILDMNSLAPSATLAITKGLQLHSELREIVLDNVFQGRLASEIAESLKIITNCLTGSHIRLTVLDFRNSTFGRLGFLNVVKLIQSAACKHLRVLNLEACQLSCEEMHLLHNFPTKLKVLGLGHNQIGDVGAKVLCGTLNELTVLEELDLSNNSFFTSGYVAIKKYLLNAHRLHKINFSYNSISFDSSEALAKAFENVDYNLRVLILKHCYMDGTMAIHICTALNKYKSLEQMDLSYNQIDCNSTLWLLKFFIEKKLLVCAVHGNRLSKAEREKVITKLTQIGLHYVLQPFVDKPNLNHCKSEEIVSFYYHYSSTEKKMTYMKEVTTTALFSFDNFEAQVTLTRQKCEVPAGANITSANDRNNVHSINKTVHHSNNDYLAIDQKNVPNAPQKSAETSKSLPSPSNTNKGTQQQCPFLSSTCSFCSFGENVRRDDSNQCSKHKQHHFSATQPKEHKEEENLSDREKDEELRESYVSSSAENSSSDESLHILKRSSTHFNLQQQELLKQNYKSVVDRNISSTSSDSDEYIERKKFEEKFLFNNFKIVRPSSKFDKFFLPAIPEASNESNSSNSGSGVKPRRNLSKRQTKTRNKKYSSDDSNDDSDSSMESLSTNGENKNLYTNESFYNLPPKNNFKMQIGSKLPVNHINDSGSDSNQKNMNYFRDVKTETPSGNLPSFNVYNTAAQFAAERKKHEKNSNSVYSSPVSNKYNVINDETAQTSSDSQYPMQTTIREHTAIKKFDNNLSENSPDKSIYNTTSKPCNNSNNSSSCKRKLDVSEENSTTRAVRKMLVHSSLQKRPVVDLPMCSEQLHANDNEKKTHNYLEISSDDDSRASFVTSDTNIKSNHNYILLNLNTNSKSALESIFQTIAANKYDLKIDSNTGEESCTRDHNLTNRETAKSLPNNDELKILSSANNKCSSKEYKNNEPNQFIAKNNLPKNEQMVILKSKISEMFCDINGDFSTHFKDDPMHKSDFAAFDSMNKCVECVETTSTVSVSLDTEDAKQEVQLPNTGFQKHCFFYNINIANSTDVDDYESDPEEDEDNMLKNSASLITDKDAKSNTQIAPTDNSSAPDIQSVQYSSASLPIRNFGKTIFIKFKHSDNSGRVIELPLISFHYNSSNDSNSTTVSAEVIPQKPHIVRYQLEELKKFASLCNVRDFIIKVTEEDILELSKKFEEMKITPHKHSRKSSQEIKETKLTEVEKGKVGNSGNSAIREPVSILPFASKKLSCFYETLNFTDYASFDTILEKTTAVEIDSSALVKTVRARYSNLLGFDSVNTQKYRTKKSKTDDVPSLLKKYETIAANQTKYLRKISEVNKSQLKQLSATESKHKTSVFGKEYLKGVSNNNYNFIKDSKFNVYPKLINSWAMEQTSSSNVAKDDTRNNLTDSEDEFDWDFN